MDCPVEEKLVRSRLKSVAGIEGLDFNLLKRKVRVTHNGENLDEIAAALSGLNMGSTLLEHDDAPVAQEEAIPWKKLAWALVLAAISEGCELYGEWVTPGLKIWEIASVCFALAAICLCGISTYRKGWLAVKNLNLNINALMAVAVTGAVLIGQWPEAAMVMVLFNVSEAIESRALLRARDAIKDLVELAPHMAEVLQPDGRWKVAHAHDIAVGQTVRVRPGEKLPLDGRVSKGQSAVNQAPITGESFPVLKKPGDFVYAGTLNGNGGLEFVTTASSHDTTLARIIHAVEEVQATRAPMQRLVDVFATWYTPCIFAIAIICALLPPLAWGAPWLPSIYTGLVMLVIGCPCALVISTPVSIVSGMAAATKSGILIKGGVFLEQGRLLRCIAFDKTGTITTGRPAVASFETLGSVNAEQAWQLAASLADRSDHPVSLAILADAHARKISLLPVDDFEATAGTGIQGKINGELYRFGRPEKPEPELADKMAALEKEARTVSILSGQEGPIALFAVADTIRPGSQKAMKQLTKMNIVPVMLTGDNKLAADAIASQAGITEVRAGLLPDQKLDAIASLEKEYGMTGMVGDGINDAPALAKANISFAMARGGTDTAIETADVALMDDDLTKLPRFICLSQATFTIIVENIVVALAIKAVFFVLALASMATMWMAVFADVGAALIVICNGMRALRK